MIGRGYTGHEHFFEVNLIHMNGRMYDANLGRFLSPDNYIQDPFNTQHYNRYGYVWNNPLKYVDPSGEFLISMLIGALISVTTNGIINIINDRPFFEGAGKAALIGAIGGGLANGIGTITQSLQGLTQVAVRGVMHAYVGGFMSAFSGGDFMQGMASGFVGAVIGGGTQGLLKKASKIVRNVATIASAGLAGGVTSKLSGGEFWDGARNGLISASLNHVAHGIKAQIDKNKYSIKGANGRELNPDGYRLSNRKLRNSIADLYDNLVKEFGNDDFEFQVTGGDRYELGGKAYSSTTNEIISNSGISGAHMVENGARAVDLRVRLSDGRNMSYQIIEPIANSLGLYYQKDYYPQDYADGHHHLYLSKRNRNNWANNN